MGQIVFSSNELNFLILQNGKDGTPADSKYTWVKYSQNEDGNPLTDNPEDAVYIGIAYNKDSAIESDNPSDYSWTKIKGNDGSDAYTIVLDNQNVSFSTSSSGIVLSDQSFECDVSVYQGTEERDDFTLGEVSSSSGITVSKSNNTIILSATMGTQITSDSGVVSVPVSIDGLIFLPKITWSQSKQGAQGIPGTGSINVVLANESQAINCTSDGLVSSNVLITIPFSAYKGVEQIASTAVVGVLPSGMTLGSNTPSTATESGEIILNVAANATLGNANVTSGEIPITITADSIEIIKHFVWTKVNNGKDGAVFVLDVSDVVVTKNYDGSYTPSQVTLNAYYQYDGERIPYEGRFIIQASYYGEYLVDEDENYLTDGDDEALIIENRIPSDYSDVYVSSEDENTYTYNFDFNSVSGLICYLCEAGTVTNILDQQSVTVISNLDTVVPVIDKITTTMTGLETSVDNINNQIINKVWQTDITESINHYDGTTTNEIRDQIAQQQISIGEIQTTVSDTTSKFEEDIQTLTEKTSELEQDAEGFKQTVSNTYATKNDLSNTSETLQSQITQTAEEINQTVQDAQDNITELQQTASEIKIEVGNKQDTLPSKIRYVRDWLNQNNNDNMKRWTNIEIVVPDDSSLFGKSDIAKGVIPTSDLDLEHLEYYTDGNPDSYISSTEIGWHYLQLDLGELHSFDTGRITIWHYIDESPTYYEDEDGNVLLTNNFDLLSDSEYFVNHANMQYDHKLEVSADGVKWFVLFDSEKNGRYTEKIDGMTHYINGSLINNAVNYNSVQLQIDINGITQRVEDTEGNVSILEQTANAIQSTVGQKQDGVKTAIRYIRDWLNGNDKDSENRWVECRVMVDDIDVAENITPVVKSASLTTLTVSNLDRYTDGQLLEDDATSYITTTQESCLELDLGQIYYDIDYIQIYHYYLDNRVCNHKLQVSSDGSSWVTLYDSKYQGGYKEESSGKTHYISDTTIMTTMTSIKQTVEQINASVTDVTGQVSNLVIDIDGLQSSVASNSDLLQSLDDMIASVQTDVANTKTEYTQSITDIRQEIDKIVSRVADVEGDVINLSEITQDADGWKALFAQLDMYDVPNVQTNISIDINGITVTNPITGQQTRMTIDEFAGYYNGEKIFHLSEDTTMTKRVYCEKGWDTGIIKMTTNRYSMNDGTTLDGVSFVVSGGSS